MLLTQRRPETDKKGFCAFFASLPNDDGVLRVFDRREYYSVHGDAAHFVAQTFYKTASVVKLLGSGAAALPGVTLNASLFCDVLRGVLQQGLGASARPPLVSVELWEERSKRWVKARSATPGRLADFEEELASACGGAGSVECGDNPVLAAVRVLPSHGGSGVTVGVACLDPSARALSACEFADDDSFSTLECVLAQMGAVEVALPAAPGGGAKAGGAPSAAATAAAAAGAPEAKRLADAVGRAGAAVARLKASDFSGAEAERSLKRLLQPSQPVESHRSLLDMPAAAAALGGLLRYAELEAAESGAGGGGGGASGPGGSGCSDGRWSLAHHDTGRFMRLDGAALRALHVLRDRPGGAPGSGPGVRGFSLVGLLDRCRSPMGKRLVASWLRQPLVRKADIEARLDCVEALVGDVGLRDALRSSRLRALPDVERLARKVDRKTASLQDVVRLYQASCEVPYIADALDQCDQPAAHVLASSFAAPLRAHHAPDALRRFEQLVEEAVDLDRLPDEFVINPAYDDELTELADARHALDGRFSSALTAAVAKLGAGGEKLRLESSPQLGWFFRLSKAEETKVRSKLGGFTTLETRKDGVKFSNSALRALSDERSRVDKAYAETQRALVRRVVDVASSYAEPLLAVGALLAQLDVLASFAEVAASAPTPFVRPTLRTPGEGPGPDRIVLSAVRHPCVEALAEAEFVPNDASLVDGRSWFTLITGPNMGGKSTFIRTVGVAVLLAQCGCFVPAAAAEITLRDAIFCRVGAGDCQLRGISTFMAEMLETAAILRSATPKSLVIIDELGRGTSTHDGFGLAWAIAAHVSRSICCPALFATHFHELTRLKGGHGVANLHVAAFADPATQRLTMLYELKPGACDQSFGIHCAEMARFPKEVVDAAKAKAAELEAAGVGVPAAKRARSGDGDGDTEMGDENGEEEEGDGQEGEGEDGLTARAAASVRSFLDALAPLGGGAGDAEAAACARHALMHEAAANPRLQRMLADE